MRPRRVLAAAVAVAALAACSGGPASEDGELSWEDSPLDEALGALWGSDQSPEDLEREQVEQNREIEEMVAACMAEEGFEYTPVEQDMGTVVTDDEDWNTEEWAQQYGYGVTTDPWSEEVSDEPEEEWTDPNEDYVAGMSGSEQEAYYEALYGPPTMEDEEWVEGEEIVEEYNWEEGGCQGRAYHEVYEGEEDSWSDPAFTEFFEAMDKLYEDAENDSRTRELYEEWATCMADAGISGMTTPVEATDHFYTEYDKLYTEADAQIDWDNLDWEALEASGTDPVRDIMEEMGLAELREREIATAVADYRCQEEIDLESRSLEIRFELEEEFVETYQADIDALLAAHGQDA
ncbi:hypothetical protein AA0Y32_01785 [Georgenia phoenicis]|uniref:hypothetical protein n=1 Tax=unclassified Georgenia TaxID=2626815 RepID=UPI0039B04B68